jgi:hypothetical protein
LSREGYKKSNEEQTMKRCVQLGMLALLFGAVGCGAKAVDGGPSQVDKARVTSVISQITDSAQDPAKFAKLWVAPPDAATLAKYKDYLYYAGGEPTVSGATAKCKMLLEKPAGTKAGEPEWEFEQSGDTWKIKSAPLP